MSTKRQAKHFIVGSFKLEKTGCYVAYPDMLVCVRCLEGGDRESTGRQSQCQDETVVLLR